MGQSAGGESNRDYYSAYVSFGADAPSVYGQGILRHG